MSIFALMHYANNAAEDTLFKMKKILNCRGRILDLSTPIVMGIVNMTGDSFYDGGKITNENDLLNHVSKMIDEGVAIIDIGGQSTRPGAERISAEAEWKRLEKALHSVVSHFPDAIISIDTFYSEVAAKAMQSGASIINDISAGGIDERIYRVAAEYNAPYIAMHMQGEPSTMQVNPYYEDVLLEVIGFFTHRLEKIKSAGVSDIILDPGFGFGKTVTHNYTLLKELNALALFGLPILAGLSRKSMITRVLDVKPSDALPGTIALNTIALLNGASILRVHDVKEASDTIKIVNQLLNK